MPLRATRYMTPEAFARRFGRAAPPLVLKEVVQACDAEGAPICPYCVAKEAADHGGRRAAVEGDRSMTECTWCGEAAHELCGGVLDYDKPELCRACRRVEDDDDLDGSEAIAVGSASTTTVDDEESESLGSLRDMLSSESEEEGEVAEEASSAAAPTPPTKAASPRRTGKHKHVCDESSDSLTGGECKSPPTAAAASRAAPSAKRRRKTA